MLVAVEMVVRCRTGAARLCVARWAAGGAGLESDGRNWRAVLWWRSAAEGGAALHRPPAPPPLSHRACHLCNTLQLDDVLACRCCGSSSLALPRSTHKTKLWSDWKLIFPNITDRTDM